MGLRIYTRGYFVGVMLICLWRMCLTFAGWLLNEYHRLWVSYWGSKPFRGLCLDCAFPLLILKASQVQSPGINEYDYQQKITVEQFMNVFVVGLILPKIMNFFFEIDNENLNSQLFMRCKYRFLFCAKAIHKKHRLKQVKSKCIT